MFSVLREDEKVVISVHRQATAGRRMPRPWIIVATLLVLNVIKFMGGTAYASSSGADVGEMVGSSGPSVSEMAWPEGIPGTTPGVKGEFELRLNIGERGDVRFRARGRAAGPGIINNALNSTWLDDPQGNAVFRDTARAWEELTIGASTGEVECGTEVNQRDDLEQVSFNVAILEVLTATIRERPGNNHLTAQEPLKVSDLASRVVLRSTFTESDLASLEVPSFGGQPRFFGDRPDHDRRDRDRRDDDCRDEDRRDRDRRDDDCPDEEDEDRLRREEEDKEDPRRDEEDE